MINPANKVGAFYLMLSIWLFSFGVAHANNDDTNNRREQPTQFNIELSIESQNAINHGVPLTLESEYAKTRNWFFFSWHVDKKHHHFIVVRHALSNRYLVKQDNTDAPHIFRSIPEALDFVAYQAILLLESYNSQADQYEMRVYLNKFKLPSPMRLNAFLSDAWDNDSGWKNWRLGK